jgi:hypothetical protein
VDAEAVGCRRLARVVDVVGPYLGAVLAARGDWLDRSEAVVDRFLRPVRGHRAGAGRGQPGRRSGAPDPTIATLRSPGEGVHPRPAGGPHRAADGDRPA